MFGHRKERRAERRDDGTAHYRMRQKLASIGNDYWVENDQGERVYKVDGKALRLRKTFVLEDSAGHELFKVQERMLRLRDTMEIEDRSGHTVATVKKAFITPLRERWIVKMEHGHDLDVKGNVVDHEYTVEDDGRKIAEVSKRWFRVADTYGVEIGADQDPALILAVAAVLDTTSQRA